MSLDIFDRAISNDRAEASRNIAPDLPSTFAENFDVSLRQSSEWNNSNNFSFARERALASFYDDVKAATGESLPLYGLGGAVTLDELNAKLTSIAGRDPESGYQPLTEQAIEQMALRRMAKAHGDAEAIAARERSWGGLAGSLAGGLIGGLSDPVQQATLPLGASGSVTMQALKFAGIAAGTQAATAALSYSTREAAVPGSSKEIPGEIAGAALFGAGLGGFFGLLGKFLGAGAKPLPTSLREEINAGASEAQINASNVFPGAAGEAANRDAVTSAVQSAVRGERVTAGETFIEAFHGSPHRFDRFDVSKIGSGEGAQSYGHGLYFAENEGVATTYSKMSPLSASGVEDLARQTFHQFDGNRQTAAAKLREFASRQPDPVKEKLQLDAAAVLESDVAIATPNVYRVKITASKDAMLDLDKPLNEQPEQVQAAVKQAMGIDYHGNFDAAKSERMWTQFQNADGKTAVRQGFIASDDKLVAQRLADAGIPGLKYLDAGSRSAEDGSRNFVVFDDKHVQIVSRNGEPLTIAQAQAVAAEAHLRPITRDVVPDVERFDRVPGATEDAASYWERRAVEASPEERAALGITDDAAAQRLGAPEPLPAVRAPDLAPEQLAALAADPQTDSAVLRNLDRLRLENVERDFTEMVRQADGTTQLVTRKLEDVLDEIDGFERAGKELLACATGMMAAE